MTILEQEIAALKRIAAHSSIPEIKIIAQGNRTACRACSSRIVIEDFYHANHLAPNGLQCLFSDRIVCPLCHHCIRPGKYTIFPKHVQNTYKSKMCSFYNAKIFLGEQLLF